MKKLSTPCNFYTNSRLASLAIVATLAAFSGCGGGGGGSSVSSTAPSATSSAVTTFEDVATSSTLIASDPDGDPLTYSIASAPSMGSAIITDVATGAFTYTPDPDKTGTDDFSFKASDGSFDSNTATVTITILANDGSPVAQAGTLSTNEDTPAPGTLVANDPNGDPLTYSIASQPGMGSVVITDAATGTYTYTPDPDQNGPDSFTFSANDGSTDSNVATVTVTINPVNDPPVATGSCGNTLQSDPAPYSGTLGATDIDSTSLTYSLPNGSTNTDLTTTKGVVTITDPTNGEFTYAPLDNADRGRDTFTYQVDDNDGGVITATETVIVGQTIMPLGDSITVGDTDLPTDPATTRGYRLPLYDALITSGFLIDLVGTEAHGINYEGFDADHEGHGGWTASRIAFGDTGFPVDGVRAWLVSNPADVVLLHIGTNGLDPTGGDIDTEAILDEIDDWENSPGGNPVTVILALIINQVPFNQDVTDFNTIVAAMANDRINNAGDNIIIIDQENGAGLNYDTIGPDMADKLHPNNVSGYPKMANVWHDALTAVNPNTNEVVLDTCP